MKLQVAIDLADTKEMLRLAGKICHIADIIEIGTPMIMKEGMVPVYEARKHFPNTLILSDTKIVDGGSLEAAYACEAGADIVIIGSAITQKEDPVKEAERYKRYIKAGDKNVQRN